MKTKELIKLLQIEDPSGESHVRIDGGAVTSVSIKEGYYDGSYAYMDGDVFVESIKGSKIDIDTIDINDIIDLYDGDMKEIKKHVRVEYDDYVNKDKENKFWGKIKEESKIVKDSHIKSIKEWSEKVLEKMKWNNIRGNNYIDMNYHNKITDIKTKMCQGEIEAVLCNKDFNKIKGKWLYKDRENKLIRILKRGSKNELD